MSDTVIKVENLSKKYVIAHQIKEPYTRLSEVIVQKAKKLMNHIIKPTNKSYDPGHETFWALRDINFEVKQGEKIGIIGRNGAGKSTLLKILSRITEPTTGKIMIKGRVASLLEVGTGFHPELTGRENIFINGSILGMKKTEIKKKFDEIVNFSGVEKFLDTPVKRYSSGMQVRLAFSVAAHLDPEILIVDEVLAVGDAEFQKKCLGKMEEAGTEGRTIIFVSHNMTIIASLCNRVILLDFGYLIENGFPSDIITKYYSNNISSNSSVEFSSRNYKIIGNEYVQLISACVKNSNYEKTVDIKINEELIIEMTFKVHKNEKYIFLPNFHLFKVTGEYVFVSGDIFLNEKFEKGTYISKCYIPPNLLNDGTYFVGLALSSFESGIKVHFYEQNALIFNVVDSMENVPTRNKYSGSIPGVIRPLLKWKTEKIS
ncbi:MAG: ABC transporter ATP-binding protein [Spirochaetota bacterium]|nr:ABC transporter ATP-binding protein [Spirochaetota bacterium]